MGWQSFQRLLDRIESRYALYTALGGSALIGVIGGWTAAYSDWVAQFGAIGWLLSGLVAAVMMAVIILLGAISRNAWIRGSATAKWSREVDSVNPMDRQFINRRINLSDLVDPIQSVVAYKDISQCDILGPANIWIGGASSLIRTGFINCDFVALSGGEEIANCIALIDVSINRCRLYKVTVYVPAERVAEFEAMGAYFLGFTRGEAPKRRSRLDTGSEMPQRSHPD